MIMNGSAQINALLSAISAAFSKKKVPDTPEKLLDQLYDLDIERRSAYQAFNLATEPELVEAAIYRIKALDAEYAFLSRKARNGAQCAPTNAASVGNGGESPLTTAALVGGESPLTNAALVGNAPRGGGAYAFQRRDDGTTETTAEGT